MFRCLSLFLLWCKNIARKLNLLDDALYYYYYLKASAATQLMMKHTNVVTNLVVTNLVVTQ